MPLVDILKFCEVARKGIDLALSFVAASLISAMRLLFLQPKSNQLTALFKKCQGLPITSP